MGVAHSSEYLEVAHLDSTHGMFTSMAQFPLDAVEVRGSNPRTSTSLRLIGILRRCLQYGLILG
jgi:hypothetical protein